MRALFEDLTYYATAQTSSCVLTQVSLPQNSNRRDLWFRFTYNGDNTTTVQAYKTRAEAKTDPAPSTYVASKTFSTSASYQSVTLTDNAANNPDLTNLAIYGLFVNTQANDSVWGYTAAPDLVSCDNMETILKTYMDSGEALEDFDSTIGIGVGPVPQAKDPVVDRPYVSIESGSVTDVSSTDTSSMEEHEHEITITVYVSTLEGAQTAWRDCKEYLAAIDSILADENRTLYGECLGVFRRGFDPPTIDPDNTAEAIGSLTYGVQYQNVWRDDKTYPRS